VHFFVTTAVCCFFIIAQRSDCRSGRFTLTQSRRRNRGVVPASGLSGARGIHENSMAWP
jgi:hypothetical protein